MTTDTRLNAYRDNADRTATGPRERELFAIAEALRVERDAARKESDVYGKAAESLGDSFRAMQTERDTEKRLRELADADVTRIRAQRDALAKALRELIEHPAELFERGHESARLTFTPETIAAARAALAKVSK